MVQILGMIYDFIYYISQAYAELTRLEDGLPQQFNDLAFASNFLRVCNSKASQWICYFFLY